MCDEQKSIPKQLRLSAILQQSASLDQQSGVRSPEAVFLGFCNRFPRAWRLGSAAAPTRLPSVYGPDLRNGRTSQITSIW